MIKTFYDPIISPSSAFEATLREQVLLAGTSRSHWLWYFLAPLSLSALAAFIFIPYFFDSLGLLLLDTLLII